MSLTIRAALAAALGAALVPISASAQSGSALVQRLDSIAGAFVRANRTVGLVAAVVTGNDTLLMKGYGKADLEWDVPPHLGDRPLQRGGRLGSQLPRAALPPRFGASFLPSTFGMGPRCWVLSISLIALCTRSEQSRS